MYIGGAFVRSESGRTMAHRCGEEVLHVARASRKDVRDAVRAARTAWNGWRARTAYNRGQIVYRLAEIMESRRAQFERALALHGAPAAAAREVDAAIDRVAWYAGWCDKIEQWLSTKNPVGSPHFNVSSPEPMGVVGIVAPDGPALLGLVSLLLPALCGSNVAVVVASQRDPITAVALAEALANSDLPAGVANILTGYRDELVAPLARHMEVNALDLCMRDETVAAQAAELACESVKRVRRRIEPAPAFWYREAAQSPRWIEKFMEIKTVWHPAGA
ncbi:MAG: aldehyde dehydrogenase family protein [Candidatus Eremiobacteraeota bacterium]|nr:aldehyde dehydrogenase family protein [Candidatus Eremiobacteraeota bacterium]